MLRAVVVQRDQAVPGQRPPRHLDVPGHVLVEVGGVDVDEAAAAVRDPAVGQHRGRRLHDGRQLRMEREVVRLEAAPGERGPVGHRHLGGVVGVARLRVEQVADRQVLARPQVVAEQDGAAPQVAAEFEDVAGGAGRALGGEEVPEGLLVQPEEPAGDVLPARGGEGRARFGAGRGPVGAGGGRGGRGGGDVGTGHGGLPRVRTARVGIGP